MFEIFGTTLYAGAPYWALALLAVAYCGGFIIRGAFGFGSNLPIIIATTWLIGAHHAIILVILTATFAQAHLFPQGVRQADWRLVTGLLVGIYIGIGVGTYVFVSLDSATLAPILGGLVIIIVAMDRFNAIQKLGTIVDLRGRPTVAGLSLVSGFVGTVSGGGGIYFLAPFLKHMCPEPIGFRATGLTLSGFFMFGRTAFIAIAGLINLTAVLEALLLMPIVILGGWIGGRWAKNVNPTRFFQGLSIMLLVGAVMLITKSLL
jgi:uncharacterized membrane protein YfcA